MQFNDKQILDLILPHLRERCLGPPDRPNQFGWEDLEGKVIVGSRNVRNPKPYDPEIESPNPAYFLVVEFEKPVSFLLVETWGDGECPHNNFYYYDGHNVKYAHELFMARALRGN